MKKYSIDLEKHLHIVCLDVPFPVDYGGVIDLFYKIRTLHTLGIRIHLHCFEYGRGIQPDLEQYCQEVYYYSRKKGHKGFSHKLPYIVCSRSNPDLLENILKDNYPILLEGVHCTFLLKDPRFKERKVFLRLHNIEYRYYRQLFYAERGILKKIYFWNESLLLKKYEKSIAKSVFIISVSREDVETYRREFGAERITYLPVFLPFENVHIRSGSGCYCLYHGNLAVSENERAAIWLLERVFNDLDVPFVIAGKNPSARLERLAHLNKNTCLVANPSEQEMQDMIAKAQVNIVPSFNCTGVKLKLLNALYNGRHCIVNEEAIKETGLESLCHTMKDASSCKIMIRELYSKPFLHEEILIRDKLLSYQFNNHKQGNQLISWIW